MDVAHRPRRSIGTVSALVLGLVVSLVAMPSAQAAPPVRERWVNQPGSFVIPAGDACPFAIQVQVSFAFGSITQFSDGTTVYTDHADFTLTNIETGATQHQNTNATFTDTLTADGDIVEVLDGRYFFGFFPGDQGPDGEVGDGGASYLLFGHFEYAYDPDANFQITSFQADGRAIDLCQLLGP